jgi:hypothetical protein
MTVDEEHASELIDRGTASNDRGVIFLLGRLNQPVHCPATHASGNRPRCGAQTATNTKRVSSRQLAGGLEVTGT